MKLKGTCFRTCLTTFEDLLGSTQPHAHWHLLARHHFKIWVVVMMMPNNCQLLYYGSHGQQVVGLKKREPRSGSQHQAKISFSRRLQRWKDWGKRRGEQSSSSSTPNASTTVPLELYIGLSILRAIDLGMTNLAMQYVNYPTKTLNSRVVLYLQ